MTAKSSSPANSRQKGKSGDPPCEGTVYRSCLGEQRQTNSRLPNHSPKVRQERKSLSGPLPDLSKLRIRAMFGERSREGERINGGDYAIRRTRSQTERKQKGANRELLLANVSLNVY